MPYRCWLRGACQVVKIVADPTVTVLKGDEMRTVAVLTSDCNDVGVLIDDHGLIKVVGTDREIEKIVDVAGVDRVVDVGGKVLMPGLVDAHTHPVFAGDRVHEFAMKLAGATYMEIQQTGGGIHFTTQKTREASEEALYASFIDVAQSMLRAGTTLLEAKSGYGLDTETELKMLRVLNRANDALAMEISPTYCGAHAVPKGVSADEQTERIVNEQIPRLASEMAAGRVHAENIDVFCEKGVFEIEASRRILTAGQQIGLRVNFHGDELNPLGGAELAAELKAHAVSHLEEISERGTKAIAESGTVAVVLPTTAYVLRLQPPPVRAMLAAGVAVALGSDFNPNAYCLAMPMVMHLACVLCRMSLEEALTAATINAAAALGRGATHGALTAGRVGDVLVVDAPRWEHLIYRFGCHERMIAAVIKGGHVVYERAHANF